MNLLRDQYDISSILLSQEPQSWIFAKQFKV